jgi:hypothetical protein
MINDIKDIPQELINIAIGVAGGLVGFLVGEGNGLKLLVSSLIVGGFAAIVFPPVIEFLLKDYANIIISQDIRTSITGAVGAVSWQLIITLKAALPLLIKKFTPAKFKDK